MSAAVRVERADRIVTLRLNRPERRNALDVAAMVLLADRLEELTGRDDARCLVLTGTDGAFCAGADLPRGDVPGRSENQAMMDAVTRVVTSLVHSPVPILAAVEGPAVGVGASIAFSCDLVLASTEAFFLLPFTGIGLVPDGGATLTVAASIGRARAMRMALLTERLPAAEAYEAGLIARLCTPGELESEVATTANALINGATRALGRAKAVINDHTLPGLDAVLARETAEQLPLLEGSEHLEGVRAFRERRRPTFGDGSSGSKCEPAITHQTVDAADASSNLSANH